MNKSQTIRSAATDLLTRVDKSGGYSHLLVDQVIKRNNYSSKDARLFTEIVYGTLQRRMTLEYYLSSFITKKRKIDPWVKWLLLLSIYQFHYLSKVPDHAVIHEAVEIGKQKGHAGIAKFVNGILRNIQRNGLPSLETINDPIERISIETSHPLWLVKRWEEMYGMDITRDMCEENNRRKKMTVRIQPMRTNRRQLIERLESDGLEAVPSQVSPQGIIITEGNILHHPSFKEGIVTIQDESSMLVSEILNPKENMTVLDACSAPGGKTTHLAEKMLDKGVIYAHDLHAKKVKLVEQKAKQLGLQTIKAEPSDARKLQEKYDKEHFDRILVDAPCSGFGVVSSKPDIKYHREYEDVRNLAAIQLDILSHVAPLMKRNGRMVYSTCTVDKEENEEVIRQFLNHSPNFEVDEEFFEELPDFLRNSHGRTEFGLQIFPQDLQSDGFFITRLKWKNG
ncbi:16S rRNA (cytosine967-C5)-methyltransferase [Gracilibacillus halotolerans]|uniref:16S rRNA (cytosine(967)-C(5))-methyltransferase n=1 Tax=Gracilibacillus halotolerans TaxID=74386 RepID=A0A841RIA9_9BACI|nr:16S rRNA (cytosine(967)-C(5))-methyltransferase RsmB [Gracilibacillus halotolerans]MBB6511393.1 16S rRNA (cytosine967-C5)-methyltransferase [Gracilibacillus halotolerans]